MCVCRRCTCYSTVVRWAHVRVRVASRWWRLVKTSPAVVLQQAFLFLSLPAHKKKTWTCGWIKQICFYFNLFDFIFLYHKTSLCGAFYIYTQKKKSLRSSLTSVTSEWVSRCVSMTKQTVQNLNGTEKFTATHCESIHSTIHASVMVVSKGGWYFSWKSPLFAKCWTFLNEKIAWFYFPLTFAILLYCAICLSFPKKKITKNK